MRIIFLDFDGVLNSHQSAQWYFDQDKKEVWTEYLGSADKELVGYEKRLCFYACLNLKTILDEYPDVRIVVSSTWRRGRSVEKLTEILRYHKVFIEDKVISRTPILNKERGYEIQQWLEENPTIEDFVILDDDSDMVSYLDTPHFIQTDGKVGFDYLAMEKVDKYFGGFNLRFLDLEEGAQYKMYSKPRTSIYIKEKHEMVYYEQGERRSVFFYPTHEVFALVKKENLCQLD